MKLLLETFTVHVYQTGKNLFKTTLEIKNNNLCYNFFIIVSSENFQEIISLVSFSILFLPKKLMYKKETLLNFLEFLSQHILFSFTE